MTNNLADSVTVVVLGQTGAGKSCFLNAYLGVPNTFPTSGRADSMTQRTEMKENRVNGFTKRGIDTQGLDDTKGLDEEHVQQMVQFLRAYPHGVNGVALVINAQNDRLDEGTKKLIRLVNNLFNNPSFWNHVAIVFTKCYRQVPVDKDCKRTDYREKVLSLCKECTDGLTPALPVYFVDSPQLSNDPDTRGEFAALHGWLVGLPALSTQYMVVPHTKFFKITKEKTVREKSRVTTPIFSQRERRKGGWGGLISVNRSGYYTETYQSGATTTITYEEIEREVQTHYDGKTTTYGDWKVLRTWTQ